MLTTSTPLVRNLVQPLNNFGPLLSNLSKNELDDYGRVIEGHNRTTVEQFFLYKIHKEKNDQTVKLIRHCFKSFKDSMNNT